MKRFTLVPKVSLVGAGLLVSALAVGGCASGKRAISSASVRSGCDAEKIEVVDQDGHDVTLDVCGVHEHWRWHPLNGFEYVGPAAGQPASVAGATDRDQDGVPDAMDACPDAAGPAGADPATNGCPPPADTDGDGVPDPQDACQLVAGVPNADPKSNGCPADQDGDGVPDGEDACADKAGVKTADPKSNGCPADQDGDGVPDGEDACVDKAGQPTADPKTNGCPADQDGDGVLDADDACPEEAGPAGGCPDRDEDGVADKDDRCPDKKGKARAEGSEWSGCP